MRILTDFHHDSLLESLKLLFENRLGYQLYRPIGMDWYKEGFWSVYPSEDTAKQFLEIDFPPTDGTPVLNRHDNLSHTITLADFKNTEFDLILASIPSHVPLFIKLRDQFQPKAKLIFQVGNSWVFDSTFPIKNLLCSAKVPNLPPNFNAVEYHQEFDLDIFHKGEPDAESKKIYSFINILQNFRDFPLFEVMERKMSDWEFKSYGGQCRDGNMQGTQALAEKMREATFIFHCKEGGDGYGHILHNAAAVGRPLICKREYYRGKFGEAFMVDGLTSINIDGKGVEQIIQEIEHFSEPARYRRMCLKMYQRFQEVVDFDKEERMIKEFIERLQ